jgi:hypothetical protein
VQLKLFFEDMGSLIIKIIHPCNLWLNMESLWTKVVCFTNLSKMQ